MPFSLKNTLIIALVKGVQFVFSLFFRKRGKAKAKNFLVISTTGLGDTLWATPALRALREGFPDSFITVITSKIGKEVLKGNRHIDELRIFQRGRIGSLLFLFLHLCIKKAPFSAVFLFHASQRILFPFAALIPSSMVIGSQGLSKGLDVLLTHPIPIEKKEHEITRRLRLVSVVGARVSSLPLIELSIDKTSRKKAEEFLQKEKILDYLPLIGLHPGAKNRYKQWDPLCFIQLGKRLQTELGAQILLSGDRSEEALLFKIGAQIPGSHILAGALSIQEFGAVIKKMSLFITNDTGPMHIAYAVSTPTLALFGPTDPDLCGPLHAPYAAIMAVQKTCFPCFGKKCQTPFCLLQLSPDEVYAKVLSLINNPSYIEK